MLCSWRGRGLCTGRGRGEGISSQDGPELCIAVSASPAGAQVEPRWNQRAISEGRYRGYRVCCAPGPDAVCASAADAVKGLLPGVLQNFALPFRLRPPAGWQVEARWG